MNDVSKRDKWDKLGETVILRCSQRGGGLYLFLTTDLVKFHELQPGDRMRIKLLEICRKPKEEAPSD